MVHIAIGLNAARARLRRLVARVARRSSSRDVVLVPTRVFDFPMDRVIDV